MKSPCKLSGQLTRKLSTRKLSTRKLSTRKLLTSKLLTGKLCAALALLSAISTCLYAEQQSSLAITVGSQSEELRRSLLLPQHGQSMTSVEDLLGPPEQSETVGNPTITTWRYRT